MDNSLLFKRTRQPLPSHEYKLYEVEKKWHCGTFSFRERHAQELKIFLARDLTESRFFENGQTNVVELVEALLSVAQCREVQDHGREPTYEDQVLYKMASGAILGFANEALETEPKLFAAHVLCQGRHYAFKYASED